VTLFLFFGVCGSLLKSFELCVAACCNVLQCVAVCCSVLRKPLEELWFKRVIYLSQAFWSAIRCNTNIDRNGPHIATHCNTLQHTVTHCNTLQHTATHSTQAFWKASSRSRCGLFSPPVTRCVWEREGECVCVCVCVCVCERERQRDRESRSRCGLFCLPATRWVCVCVEEERERDTQRVGVSVCVAVYVCVKGRERQSVCLCVCKRTRDIESQQMRFVPSTRDSVCVCDIERESVWVYASVYVGVWERLEAHALCSFYHGAATISRLLQIINIFCKISSL